MDYTSMQFNALFAQPQPLRPYQYPSRYAEHEDPFGVRPLSVPASHVLRSNSYIEPDQDTSTAPPTTNHGYGDLGEFTSLTGIDEVSTNPFSGSNPQIMVPLVTCLSSGFSTR